MGQDGSTPLDESVAPSAISSRTLNGVAEYMRSGRAKKIVIMAGAGISTSAGIPDFRSPGTGLYDNLARLNLPYPEAVFDISYFRTNPLPFYTLAKELYPGRYRPTVTHAFFKLLQDKGTLLKVFTQNIDCLERSAGVLPDKVVEAHGSFAAQACIECHAPFPDGLMREHVERADVPRCGHCAGLVKPRIVFFGEQLPEAFHRDRHLPASADLCIVLGTSLQVQPFASLPAFCAEGVPRILVNREQVGGLGSRPDDVLLLGDCDVGVRKLAAACGWAEELEAIWAGTAPEEEQQQEAGEVDAIKTTTTTTEKKKSKDETLAEEVEKLTREVEDTLNISTRHTDKVKREHIDEDRKRDTAASTHHHHRPLVGDGHRMRYDEKLSDGLGHVFPHMKKSAL